MKPTRTIVVGAGSAGCVVASHLSQSSAHEVLLLEAGPDRTPQTRPAALASLNWMEALEQPDALWPDLRVRRQSFEPPTRYLRGRGVGGSAGVNGMMALPGLPSDYDRWEHQHGCSGWSWADMAPSFNRHRRHLRRARPSQLEQLDHALAHGAERLGLPAGVDLYDRPEGTGRVWLTCDDASRRSVAETDLDPARGRANLRVLGDTEVERVMVTDDTARAVQLATGRQLEADRVVLTAGAIQSPTLLLRSGLEHPGIGQNLRDHPSAAIPLALPASIGQQRPRPPIVTALRTSSGLQPGDIQVLPMLHPGTEAGPQRGALIVGIMSTTSSGHVQLDVDDPLESPDVELNLLDTSHDRAAAAAAGRLMANLLTTPAFADADLQDPGEMHLDDPDWTCRWLTGTTGGLVHAAGTCRMGRPDDPGAVVGLDGRVLDTSALYVMDASVLPDLPSSGPHLPTVIVAERMARRLLAATSG